MPDFVPRPRSWAYRCTFSYPSRSPTRWKYGLQEFARARRSSMGPCPGQNQHPPEQVRRVEGVITPSLRPAIATTILKTEQGW